jgi:hypothetical protein
MDKMVKNRSSVTYNDNNVVRKTSSNEVEIEISNDIIVNYECYKNTIFIGEPCNFYATIYNPNLTPLVEVKVFFNLSDNLPYVLTSLMMNNCHYKINDFYKGLYLDGLSSLQKINISFTAKAIPPFKSSNAFSQMIVSYCYYHNGSKICIDQQSNLVCIKIIG